MSLKPLLLGFSSIGAWELNFLLAWPHLNILSSTFKCQLPLGYWVSNNEWVVKKCGMDSGCPLKSTSTHNSQNSRSYARSSAGSHHFVIWPLHNPLIFILKRNSKLAYVGETSKKRNLRCNLSLALTQRSQWRTWIEFVCKRNQVKRVKIRCETAAAALTGPNYPNLPLN